jgi:hypothetical protein
MAGSLVFAFGNTVIVLSSLMILAGYGVHKRWQWGRLLTLIFGGMIAVMGSANLWIYRGRKWKICGEGGIERVPVSPDTGALPEIEPFMIGCLARSRRRTGW